MSRTAEQRAAAAFEELCVGIRTRAVGDAPAIPSDQQTIRQMETYARDAAVSASLLFMQLRAVRMQMEEQ